MLLPWYWAIFHLVSSALATFLLLHFGRRYLRLDLPGERRSHQTATPRGGGLAIVMTILTGKVIAVFLWSNLSVYLVDSAVGLAMVAWVGWMDDRQSMPIRDRFIVHVLASALLANAVYCASHAILSAAIIFLSGLVLINVWNFMDGINGLAASQAAVVAFVYAHILPFPLCFFPMAIAFSSIGFLPFNFPNARLFLGDSGSCALGYSMAACLALVIVEEKHVSLLSWLPLSVFLADAGFTLLCRLIRRERWWTPHTQHVYQRTARFWHSHTRVTLIYLIFSCIAGLLFLFARHSPFADAMMIALLWSCVLAICWRVCYLSLK